MTSEYLGKVNGVITSEQLDNLISVGGTSLVAGDITWLWFKKENKNILLADRKISKQSWDVINSAGCKDGKSININNTECICRIMSGATKDPYENTDTDAGGEWNEFIVNLVPDNSISNWKFGGVAEWCKERASSSLNSAWALSRGHSSVTNFTNAQRTAEIGFRPLLEVNNTSPTFDIISTDIGEVTNVKIPYVITDLENDNFTLIEKIDGNIIRTLYSQPSGSSYILDLSSIWDDLTYGKHTIEIVADDCKILGKSTVTITFKKINQPITTIPITSNLKQAVDHSKKIKKEIEYQNLKLKNNLIEKGVECSDTDKMSSLIDNIRFASSTVQVSNEYIMDLTSFTSSLVEYAKDSLVIDKLTFPFNGSIKFCFSLQCRATFHSATAKIDLYSKDGLLKSTESFTTTSTTNAYASKINCEYDILNIKESDYITVTALSTHNTYGIHFNELSFKGEVI